MASVNLSGILLNPEGEPDDGAIVKFTLLSTTGGTVQSSTSTLLVPYDGAYDIDLVYGNMRIDYISGSKERFVAIVTINADTVATSLPELLSASVPPTDAQLLQFQALLADSVTAKDQAVTAKDAAETAAATLDIVNDLTLPYVFDTVADMTASVIAFPVGKILKTKGYYTTNDGGGAEYSIKTATQATTDGDAVDEYGSFAIASGNVAIINQGVELSVLQVGMNKNNTTGDDQGRWHSTVNSPNYHVDWVVPKGTYRMSVIRLSNVNVKGLKGNLINLFYAGGTPTMGQFNSDINIKGLNIQCTETDLDQSRCAIEGASRVNIEGGTIKGFRDITGATDGWGFRVSDATTVTLKDIGFDDNTQSDIAIVDNNRAITIDGCYGVSSTLHINFEPNVPTEFNRAIVLKNMSINTLSLLDSNQGNVSSDVQVQGCEIGDLKYAGSKALISACTVHDFSNLTSLLWFGELKLDNTLAISENLLDDPYMFLVGFNKTESLAQGYKWHKSDTSNITNFNSNLKAGSDRFIRINPDGVNGRVTYENTQIISVTAGETYLIAINGRWVQGANSFVRVNNGGATELIGRIFNQENKSNPYFSTQKSFIKIVETGELRLEIGIPQTQAGIVDVASVSIHKVLDRSGGNTEGIIGKTHVQTGIRTIEYDTLPTLIRTTINGIQLGDRVLVGEDTYVYNGTTTFEKITQA